jgi:hypothetical protein
LQPCLIAERHTAASKRRKSIDPALSAGSQDVA